MKTHDAVRLEVRQIPNSGSEFLQFCELGNKRNGFFVEFGATDGKSLSNTHLLETAYGWRGILAEPARSWHEQLRANRRCEIDYRCVSPTTGSKVVFNETAELELSTIDAYSNRDARAAERASGTRYEVETVSLNDLLVQHGAPKSVDYLSIDIEGSELPILRAFDFSACKPAIITVEHNFVASSRQGIFDILSSSGYVRKYPEYSLFDDWYVLPEQRRT